MSEAIKALLTSEVGKQVPALVVLFLVVCVFCIFLWKVSVMFAKTLAHIGDGCHVSQNKMAEALDGNTEALAANRVVMEGTQKVLGETKDLVRGTKEMVREVRDERRARPARA